MSSRYSIVCCRKECDGRFQEASASFESPEFDDQDLTGFSADHGDVIYVAEQKNVGIIPNANSLVSGTRIQTLLNRDKRI